MNESPSLSQTLKLKVDQAEIAFRAGRLGDAERLLLATTKRHPNFLPARIGLGEVCHAQGRWGDAALHYEAAWGLDPQPVLAQLAGFCWFVAGDPARGKRNYSYALKEGTTPLGVWVDTWIFWLGYDPATPPQAWKQEAVAWAKRRFPPPLASEPDWEGCDPDRPLHIGYVSGDLKAHAMRRWVEPLLCIHDPNSCRITLFSNNEEDDQISSELHAYGHDWHDIARLDDLQALRFIRDSKVDVLVDLSGYTARNRLGVFALRAAPVQITMLGYSGTTGLEAMDYRWVDAKSHPIGQADLFFTERLIRGAECRFAFQPPAELPPISPLPSLGSRPFTFGCLNNPATVNPQMMVRFARILKAVPGSRLRLMLGSPRDVEGHRMRREALRAEGVDPNRLEFFYRGSTLEYLNQFHSIDLCLGTHPFQGGTSKCESALMGVPVLCLKMPGYLHKSERSLMEPIGLEDWVVEGEEAYIAAAVQAAADLPKLAELRGALRERFLASPLCDFPSRAREREALFRSLWQEHCAKA